MMFVKKYRNESGDLLVRALEAVPLKAGNSIVEMLYLWDGDAGCVVGFWILRLADDKLEANFTEIGERLVSSKIEAEPLMKALRYGRKLADIILECSAYE